mmetsp:Transcript_15690/g.42558  ORF Transcript_15690/g.42558 Transcript_15690/m.42558 type:complete len:83 (-) Transcript_15690:571-819(-)
MHPLQQQVHEAPHRRRRSSSSSSNNSEAPLRPMMRCRTSEGMSACCEHVHRQAHVFCCECTFEKDGSARVREAEWPGGSARG